MATKNRSGARSGASQSNGRGAAAEDRPDDGVDNVGLDQLIAQIGRRRLRPGPEAARMALSLGRRPLRIARRGGSLATGVAAALAGSSERTAPKGDRRFSDPAWQNSWFFRRLLQSYLAISEEARALVDEADL